MKELKNELCRCMGALATVEPGTEEHTRLVADVDRIMRLLWDHAGVDGRLTEDDSAMARDEAREAPPETENVTEPDRNPDPVDEPGGAEPGEPVPVLTKEEVKAKLLTLSNKYDALDLSAVMGEMGYSKLSDIPVARYGELLTRAEDAVKALVA